MCFNLGRKLDFLYKMYEICKEILMVWVKNWIVILLMLGI